MSSTTTPTPSPGAMPEAEDPIIWRDELTRRVKKTSETIRLWMKSGKLPKPDTKISSRTMGWRMSTLRRAGIEL